VSFELKDYAEIDHGYAATVHKSQGVTVDRAHVLATQGMDRHATYVGLTRHREAVSLHWSRDEMGSREGLDARLGRERLKDTSLDYDGRPSARGRADLTGRYAERRGFDPLHPASAIVVRAPEPAAEQGKRPADPVRDERLAQAVAAGRAGFRARYEAHRQQQQALARTEAAARELVGRWDRLLEGYSAALPRLEADPKRLDGARDQLVQFGRGLREQPEAVRLLQERGEAFGMAERPNLTRILADRQPERVVANVVRTAEAEMRAHLKTVAEQEALRQQEQQRAQQVRQRQSRGHGMSM